MTDQAAKKSMAARLLYHMTTQICDHMNNKRNTATHMAAGRGNVGVLEAIIEDGRTSGGWA